MTFCPLSLNLEGLVKQVYQVIRISEIGGLEAYFGKPIATLPRITVYFYQLVLAAHQRYVNEREAARMQLIERANRKAADKAS